jgi:hypothetical protein
MLDMIDASPFVRDKTLVYGTEPRAAGLKPVLHEFPAAGLPKHWLKLPAVFVVNGP